MSLCPWPRVGKSNTPSGIRYLLKANVLCISLQLFHMLDQFVEFLHSTFEPESGDETIMELREGKRVPGGN